MPISRFLIKLGCLSAALVALFSLPSLVAAQEKKTEPETKAETKKLIPVALEEVDGKTIAKLAPKNSSVEFTGVHAEGEPRPRLGGFKAFAGSLGVENEQLKSINVEFEISAIWTEFDDLTKHLMNADFFEAEKFPKASFKSTSLTDEGDGKYKVTGDLTLHGETSAIEFPAQFARTDKGVTLKAEFVLDRSKFGMDKMLGGVKKEVDLRVIVGQATRGVTSKAGNGGESKDDQASKTTNEKMQGHNGHNQIAKHVVKWL